MKAPSLRLFAKVTIIMVSMAVVPLAILGTQILNLNKESLQYEVLRFHSHMAESLADKINNHIVFLDEKLSFAVTTLESKDISWTEKQSILQSLIEASSNFSIIAIVTRDGKEFIKVYNPELEPELAKNPALAFHNNIPMFQKFLKSGKQELDISYRRNKPHLTIYYPLNTPTGKHAIFIDMSLESLWNVILETKIGKTGYAMLVDNKKRVIAAENFEISAELRPAKNIPIVDSALRGSSGASEYKDGSGTAMIGASAHIPRLGGAVITQQLRDEAYAAALKGKHRAVTWLIIWTVLTTLVAFVFARQITKPVYAIIDGAKQVNLSERRFPKDIEVTSGDELRELADTFNAMKKQLVVYTELQVEKLLAEKTKTEAIVFSIADGIIMTDRSGIIAFINNQATDILKIDLKTSYLLGKPLWDYLPHTELMDILWDITHNPEEGAIKEIDLSTPSYKKIYQVSSKPVKALGKKEEMGVVTVLHDVTLEKEISKMKDDFLHSITHDLRNPMTSIRGFLKFLRDGMGGPLTDQQKNMLEIMNRASVRLLSMINDILDIAKLEAGRLELTLSECDLKEMIKHVTELLQSQTQKKHINLITEIPENLSKITADPMLLERVFINLISNSIKFTPDSGKITVKITEDENELKASIIDTGEGIPQEFLDKIFDKFQQVTGQRKGGTGLGLTICKYIVDAHNGNIWVESKIREGSKFIFTLPKKQIDDIKYETASKKSNST